MWSKTELMEQILQSTTAQEIIDYVSPIYGNSYIGLWLFQIIGMEFEEVKQFSKGIYDEIIISSATWSLPFWEKEYGIDNVENMSYEQRRDRLLAAKKSKAMNPKRMKDLLESTSGAKIELIENVSKNGIRINLFGHVTNMEEIIALINKIKPAHITYNLMFAEELNIAFGCATRERLIIFPSESEYPDKDYDPIGNADWYVDEEGNILEDEEGNIFIFLGGKDESIST